MLALFVATGCGLLSSSGPEGDAGDAVTAEPKAEAVTAEPEAGGAATAEARSDTTSIAVGDCIDDPGMTDVSDLPVLPCSEPHSFEAFASSQMPDGDYPGVAAANTAANDFCAREFSTFVGLEYDASVLEILVFYPVEETWTSAGNREILCFVAAENEAQVTGTLRDAGK
ncbi:septum formation family protein [Arthrobacter cheniae]|uniref:septum formation family protein n=1 Tax=Arthrobacter cheniae TaxID=1258888 RepID=UPI0011C4672A|nr:septum formation family protein [Arthrobacter cheniae]